MTLPAMADAIRAAAGDRGAALRSAAEAVARLKAAGVERESFISFVDPPSDAGEMAVGPLVGCLFGVKDNIAVAGAVTTCGSRVFEHTPPAARDSWIVAALQRAGALCIGKNSMHEFALGATGRNARYGTTPNPWDPGRHCGGSSGGSALAVARGEVHLSIGTDSGGSVRMPASFVGIAGFKPTPNVLPMHGVAGASWSMDCLGLFTRTVADTAAVWRALRPADTETAPRRARIAYLHDDSMGPVDAKVWRGYLAAVECLRAKGYDLTGISLPGLEACPRVCVSVVYPEVASAHHELLRTHAELYEPDIWGLIALGELWSGRHLLDAQRARSVLRGRVERAMEGFDFLLTPTVAIQPPRFDVPPRVEGEPGGSALYTLMRFTVAFNVVSYPGISIPAGLDEDGLPLGIQLVGRPRTDSALLDQAQAIERTLGPMPTR